MKNKKSYNVKNAIVLTIIGAIILVSGYILKNVVLSDNLVDVTAKVVSYGNADNGKINVMCKYYYKSSDYTYICHTINESEKSNYPVDSEENIKVNKDDPSKIVLTNLNIIYILLNAVGLLFLVLAIVSLLKEIIRIAKSS